MKQKDLEQRRRKEDQALNRVLLWFGGAVVFELFVLLIDRLYVNYSAGMALVAYQFGQALIFIAIGFAVLAAVCAVWLMRRSKTGGKRLLPAVGLVSALVLAAGSLIVWHWYGKGVQLLFALGITVAVLAMIYYLYQREFFVIAALTGGGLLNMWLLRTVANQKVLVYLSFLVLGLLSLGTIAAARVLQVNKGMLALGGQRRRILAKGASYPLLYAAGGVTAGALILALVLGAAAAYYLMFILSAWLFIMAVYFTVRLM